MTITEFLLARIAEDEVAAVERERPALRHIVDLNNNDRTLQDRVLAECEAKRRIVEACNRTPSGASWEYEGLALDVLGQLASVYEDHPDFAPAWRVTD